MTLYRMISNTFIKNIHAENITNIVAIKLYDAATDKRTGV